MHAPDLTPAPSDPIPARADVVIVGAGFAGLYAAARLARHGSRVVVLEARDGPAHGASGREPGVLTAGLPEHAWRLASAVGDAHARDLYALSARGHAHVRERVAVTDGAPQAAIDQREIGEIETSAEALQRLGVGARVLDADAACEALGGEGFTAALDVDGDGAIDPVALGVALLDEARQAGATVAFGARVETIAEQGGDETVRGAFGTARCDVVVLAGGWAVRDLDPWFADKVMPVREHAIRLADAGGVRPGRAQLGYVTWRPDAAGGLTVTGCRWATQHMEVEETRETPLDDVIDKIRGFASRNLPAAGGDETHRWARITTHTCDGLPILGPLPGNPTRVALTGFQGRAPSLALAAADGVVDGLLDGTSPLLRPDWTPGRFVG